MAVAVLRSGISQSTGAMILKYKRKLSEAVKVSAPLEEMRLGQTPKETVSIRHAETSNNLVEDHTVKHTAFITVTIMAKARGGGISDI